MRVICIISTYFTLQFTAYKIQMQAYSRSFQADYQNLSRKCNNFAERNFAMISEIDFHETGALIAMWSKLIITSFH